MLFISRNARLYHYVAHMSFIRRYMITCMALIVLITGWLYFIYYPVCASYNKYAYEYAQLFKKCENMVSMHCAIKELSHSCDSITRTNDVHIQTHIDNYFKDEWTFVFDTVHASNLQLTAYTMIGASEKDWYKKEKYHIELSGNLAQCLHFFEMIKGSQKMITCSNVVLSATHDASFGMSCDIGITGIAH